MYVCMYVCCGHVYQCDMYVGKDLDKILDDFDENDRQEQVEEHRYVYVCVCMYVCMLWTCVSV